MSSSDIRIALHNATADMGQALNNKGERQIDYIVDSLGWLIGAVELLVNNQEEK